VLPDYFEWTKTVDGVEVAVDRYATTETADDAVAWLAGREGPWFLWLAFQAPHTPFHLPPAELIRLNGLSGEPDDIEANPRRYYNAAVQALDTELGRVLSAIPEHERALTWIVFLGDNGTPGEVARPPIPRRRAKGTLYQGGIHVPLVIAGPGVADGGRRTDALVDVTDLFTTVVALGGGTPPDDRPIDGRDLSQLLRDGNAEPPRTWVHTALFGPNQADDVAGRTIRDDRFKLIVWADGGRGLFDLAADPFETVNLLDAPLDADARRRPRRSAAAWPDRSCPACRRACGGSRSSRGRPASGGSAAAPWRSAGSGPDR
jgi:arylsulfatase A-like enzyme